MSNSLIINTRFLRFIAKKTISYHPFLICIIACLSIACSDRKRPVTPAIGEVEGLIWTDADSARCILERISQDSLPQSEQMYWQLLYQHTAIRLGYPVSPDSVMSQVVNYFATHGNKKYLGEALYVQGVEYYLLNQYNDAILCLKQAEDHIAALDTAEPYIGMIHYMQGKIMDEGENLYYTAKDCYIKALPYFQPLPDRRRLACCYRDIARTLDYARDSTAIFYYDTALHIAQTNRDTALYMDILMQRVSFGQQFDSVRLYELCKFDIDSLQHTNYASYVAEYLIERNRLSEAAVYLALASEDTVKSDGRAERYHYLHSWLDAQMGRTTSAYDELRQVYLNQSAQIAEDAKVRTFAIARHYDLEREQEKSLRLTIRQQKLRIVTGSITAVLVIIVLLSAFIIRMHRDKEKQLHQKQEIMRLTHEAENARLQQEQALARAKHGEERARLEQENERQRLRAELAQTKLSQLHTQLDTTSQFLHRILADRIELAKYVNQTKKLQDKPIAPVLQAYADRYSFADNANWQAFLQEFNLAYGDFIPYIHEHYPTLSESDIQYIILVTLGFDNSDIAFVLNRSAQTIWNRRNTICKRLGDARLSLDQWITLLRDNYVIYRSTREESNEAPKATDATTEVPPATDQGTQEAIAEEYQEIIAEGGIEIIAEEDHT